MEKQNDIKIFDHKKVRTLWDAEQEKWYLSIVDVIAVLTDQVDFQGARNYRKVLKHRLIKEGNETVTNRNQLNTSSYFKRAIIFPSAILYNVGYQFSLILLLVFNIFL